MPEYPEDKTLLDEGRRLLNLKRPEVEKVLPEYFAEDYPKLAQFLEAYYDFLEKEGEFGNKLKKLYRNRDTTQVPSELLQFLEDELLLGQAYFGGFLNKREAIKFSNYLYRSKGSKYSIEQFFRGFFGIDPQVIYPKENIFKVGPQINLELDSINSAGQQIENAASKLGPESSRFLTDDERFQVYSILIKSNLPISTWLDTYKLFVHPAGAHIAGELVLELVNDNVIQSVRESGAGIPVEATFELELQNTGISSTMFSPEVTLIQDGDSDFGMVRVQRDLHFTNVDQTTIDSTGDQSMIELLSPNSFTMDDSSNSGVITLDQDSTGTSLLTLSTMDEGRYRTLFDSENSADSAHYPFV